MLERAISGPTAKARKVILYGDHGVGKSTWAAGAPSPFALDFEGGLNDIGVTRTDHVIRSLASANELISELGTRDHPYKTVIIDTLDWLERLIHADVCRSEGKSTIEKIPYGRGYKLADEHWQMIRSGLNQIIDRGIAVILLAHSDLEKVEPANADAYTRWTIDIHKNARGDWLEWADEVLYAELKVRVIQKEQDFGRKVGRAIAGKERVIHTVTDGTFVAKQRLEIKEELPMEWAAYADAVRAARPKKGDIQGIVKDGSSKVKEEVLTNGE